MNNQLIRIDIVSRTNRILSASITLMMLLFSHSALGMQKPSLTAPSWHVALAKLTSQSTTLNDTAMTLSRDSVLLNASVTVPISPQWSVGVNAGYDRRNYDWGGTNQASPENLVSLFGDSGQVWQRIHRYHAGLSFNYRFDQQWLFFVAPKVQYAYVDNASASHAQSYGIVASGMYRFGAGHMLGLGLAYLNDIDEVNWVPYLAISWAINDQWRLSNPFNAGFSGPAGLELSYQINPLWSFGVGGAKRTHRFLINDDSTSMEVNEWLSFLRISWQATPALAFNAYTGYSMAGELDVSSGTTFDLDNHGTASIAMALKF